MKNLFPNKSFSFFAGLFLLAVPTITNAATVSFGVTFGNPQSNGGVCVGKGVCRESFSDPSSVSVSFVVNETNPDILMMRFSKAELMAKQPEKAEAFNDPLGYSFDSPYALTRPMFAPLNLLPGAAIQAATRFSVLVSGDIITVYIPYQHID